MALDTRGQWRSVDFDVFTKIESNQAAHGIASQWWKVLKRVIKDYREYLDKRCSQDWGRRIGMLASQDLLWPNYCWSSERCLFGSPHLRCVTRKYIQVDFFLKVYVMRC